MTAFLIYSQVLEKTKEEKEKKNKQRQLGGPKKVTNFFSFFNFCV